MKTLKVSAKQVLLVMCMGATSPSIYSQTIQNQGTGNMGMQTMLTDTSFVRKNIMDNRMEINLSQLALQRSSNPKITSIAQQMVTDHSLILNDLQSFASANNITVGEWKSTGNGSMKNNQIDINTDRGANGMNNNGTMNNQTSQPGIRSNMDTTGKGMRSGNNNPPANRNTSGTTTNRNNSSTMGNGNNYKSNADSSRNNNNSNRDAMGTINKNNTTNNTSATGNGTAPGMTGNGTTSGTTGNNTTSGTSSNSNNGNNNAHSEMNHDAPALYSLQGPQFDEAWISQMFTMHENKLNELTQASQSVHDSQLKSSILKAIPMIRTHRDALAQLKSQGVN